MTPEKRVQTKILNYLKQLKDRGEPIFFERREVGGFSYKKGSPDLWGIYNGLHFEIEVKKVGGHTSPMQDKFASKMQQVGALYILADQLDDVVSVFENLIQLFKEKSPH